MFNNIGAKLKRASEIVCWSGITLSVLYAMALTFNSFSNFLHAGLGIGVVGSLASWIAGLLLYGFGELIENTAALKDKFCSDDRAAFYEEQEGGFSAEFEKNTPSSTPAPHGFDYRCRSITVLDEYSRGDCQICKSPDKPLGKCIIKTDIGTRELSVCGDCASRFKKNAKN